MNSFNHVESWIEQIRENGDDGVVLVLVGNKEDMEEKRQVSRKQGDDLALKYRMRFYEVSAKENRGIREMFEGLTREVMARNEKRGVVQGTAGAILNESNEGKKKKKNDCCG